MQLASLEIDNFKRLDRLALSFLQQDGTPRPLTLIAGAGGTGKTTVLQAIALVLSLATWRTASPGAFAWPGFSSVRLSSRGPTRVALTVHFDEDEQAAIGAAYAAWAKRGARGDEALLAMAKPLLAPRVRLVFEDGALHFPDGRGAEGQFLGRSSLRAVHQEDRAALRQTLSTLGDVFWFDEHRSLGTRLIGGRGTDLARVERLFAELWPGVCLEDLTPPVARALPGACEHLDLCARRGDLRYDVAELSAGEKDALFLLHGCAVDVSTRSVVLIDEVALHLHPPQQQALLSALRRLAPSCQFLVTTRSDAAAQVVPTDDIVRLLGEPSCP